MGLTKLEEIEINDPPIFEMEQKVRLKKMVRNDGTFPGIDIGVTLAKKGDTGYVVSIGTYLQMYYIYAVHFIDAGHVIGCRAKELESAEKTVESDLETVSNQESGDGRQETEDRR